MKIIIYLTVFLLTAIFGPASAQTPEISTSSRAGQVRNKMQLLKSSEKLIRLYQTLVRRLKAYAKRLANINNRLRSRLAKLKISQATGRSLTSRLETLDENTVSLESDLTEIEIAWQNLTDEKQAIQNFTSGLRKLYAKIENLIAEQKKLIKELKKYDIIISPTPPETEPTTGETDG